MSEGHVATSRDIRNALIRWLELPAGTTLTLSKLGEMMEDSFAKHRAVLAPYYQDMVDCIEAQDAALATSQARLSEAVKVLEEAIPLLDDAADKLEAEGMWGTSERDMAIRAKAFVATLGEENEA